MVSTRIAADANEGAIICSSTHRHLTGERHDYPDLRSLIQSVQGAAEVLEGSNQVSDTTTTPVRVEDGEDRGPELHADTIVFTSLAHLARVAARSKLLIEEPTGRTQQRRSRVNKIVGGGTVSAGRSGDKLGCLLIRRRLLK